MTTITTAETKNICEISHNYFTNLNILTKKIEENINETKSKYTQEIWNRLNENEKNSIIDDELIKPEIALKYYQDDDIDINDELLLEKKNSTFDGRNLYSYNAKLKLPNKIIINDYGMCRDEHSAPFSFKTKSQINLNLFNIKPTTSSEAIDETDTRRSIIEEIRLSSSVVAEKPPKHAKKSSGGAKPIASNDIIREKEQQQQVMSPQSALKANLNVNFLTKLFKRADSKDEDSTLLILQTNSLEYDEELNQQTKFINDPADDRKDEQTDLDDQKANSYNECNSLLEDNKNFDFLNNW